MTDALSDAMRVHIGAFRDTVRATIALGEEFGDAEWELATDLPGWAVKDVYSHIAGVERWILGDPQPEHDLPDYPHVRHAMARRLEIDVDLRRPRPGADVLAELRGVLDRRLDALEKTDPAEITDIPLGRPLPYAEALRLRVFDCWVHEQDIRRAVGRPGNLGSPAAAITQSLLTLGLPKVVAKKAAARPGTSVVFEVTGALPLTACVSVGDDGRGRLTDPVADPTALLRLDWTAFIVLAGGRRGPDAVDNEISGDRELGERILSEMSVTP